MVLSNPSLFIELLELIDQKPSPITRRAARVIAYCFEYKPTFFNDYLPKLFAKMLSTKDESLTFILMNIFTNVELPKDEETIGELTDFCIQCLEKVTEKAAIKIYAVSILTRIAEIYPELAYEFSLLFKIGFKTGTVGYKAKVRESFRKLSKIDKRISKISKDLDLRQEISLI